jgi:hypothetical protein
VLLYARSFTGRVDLAGKNGASTKAINMSSSLIIVLPFSHCSKMELARPRPAAPGVDPAMEGTTGRNIDQVRVNRSVCKL